MTRNVFTLTVDPGIAFSTTRERSLRDPQIAGGAPAAGLIVPSTLADNAIEVATGLSHQTVSARLRGLVLREQIEDSGQKARTRSGRRAVVWRVK